MKKILLLSIFLVLTACDTTSTKEDSSSSESNMDDNTRKMVENMVMRKIHENGEYLLCDQKDYRACYSISQSQCVTEMRGYKAKCYDNTKEAMAESGQKENSEEFQKNFIVCMMLEHMLQHSSGKEGIQKASQCIKGIELDKDQIQKSILR